MVYAREFDGATYEFGVLGVERGTLIMYDAQTRSRWSQLFGEAVEGPMAGHKLVKLPSVMTTWQKWRALHPDTSVYVKRSVPYRPRFTAATFAGYASEGDGPLGERDWVVGVEGHVRAQAYPARWLARSRVVNDELEGRPILVYLSADLATARVFRRRVGDRPLRFELIEGDLLRDLETGSSWDPLAGAAVSGPLAGSRLEALVSTYSLWFAWRKYRPDTVVRGQQPEDR